MKKNKIYQGDCLEVLKTFPDESINGVMTSPPYWLLRDYGIDGQLGLEPTFQEYINKLCNIFDEVKRVLKKDGTCWVNIGDTYGQKTGLEDKNLCNIPSRFSIEMQNRGWILRNVIIWHKPSCMPTSVKDRFTVDFEYLFFFVKNKKYWFKQQTEPVMDSSKKRMKGKWLGSKHEKFNKYNNGSQYLQSEERMDENRWCKDEGRNKRCVWSIVNKGFSGSHFAVYPIELCETPIKAGCKPGGIVLDMFFGSGTTGIAALKQNRNFIGIELNPEYIKIAYDRLKPYLEQNKLFNY